MVGDIIDDNNLVERIDAGNRWPESKVKCFWCGELLPLSEAVVEFHKNPLRIVGYCKDKTECSIT